MRDFKHVVAMADYALKIREQLAYVNEHSFNNFRMRVGINIGPVMSTAQSFTNVRLFFSYITRKLYSMVKSLI